MFKLPVRKSNSNWYPLSDIENLQKEMNRLFDFSFPGFGYADSELAAHNWVPAVDVKDAKDSIHIKADLPGFKKDDIKVSIENDVLTITGERKDETQTKEDNYVRVERYQGGFQRSIVLPTSVDTTKLNATFKDGVLELNLGKREDAKPKQINVDIK